MPKGFQGFQKGQPKPKNAYSFKKGYIPSKNHRLKIGLLHKGKHIGKDNHRWVGNKITIRPLHIWVERRLGKPHFCEHCGNRDLRHRQYHWANKSRKYKRLLSDWIRLCVKCHKEYDKKVITHEQDIRSDVEGDISDTNYHHQD